MEWHMGKIRELSVDAAVQNYYYYYSKHKKIPKVIKSSGFFMQHPNDIALNYLVW